MNLFGKKKTENNTSCNNLNSKTVQNEEQKNINHLDIKILGSGCKKCNELESATKEALLSLGIENNIEHVKDFSKIASYGVMITPALVINGKVMSYGKVLKKEEVAELIRKVRG